MKIGIQRLHGTPLPTRAYDTDAAFDLRFWPERGKQLLEKVTSRDGDTAWKVMRWGEEPLVVRPFDRFLLPTGIKLAIPPEYFGRVSTRSSTFPKTGIIVMEGTIDAGYRGEVYVSIGNTSLYPCDIEPGRRLAQLLILPRLDVEWCEIDVLLDSQRGQGGIGSSGH